MAVTRTFRLLLIWVFTAALAFAAQLNWMSATYSPDGYVPAGNDSFYHARRIIDTARDPSAFYEFDERIHAPEGSLLTWPWGYDYAMAMLLRAGSELGLAADPMKFLAYAPTVAVLITVALSVAIATALGLSGWGVLVLALCIALSPLTQGMHGIGNIDHHYAEYIVILAFLAGALCWMRQPESRVAAATTAAILGLGPAIHNGLFALQVPLLLAAGIGWLRGVQFPPRPVAVFGLVLATSTLMILLPSLPFRRGMAEYYLLSWFHLYVALCTALVLGYWSRFAVSARSIAGVLGLSVVLGVPLMRDLVLAGEFIGKDADALHAIQEARSVWTLYQQRGFIGVSNLYSSLVVLAPLVWLGCAWALFRVRDQRYTLLLVYCLLALPLLLAQFRFHYYGSIALYLPLLLLVDRVAQPVARRVAIAATVLLFAVAYYPAIRHGLAGGYQLGNDLYYPMTRLAMPALARECARDPGIVLARSNEGHFIRYHTDCSVIANNFLLTDQHLRAVSRVGELFNMTPEQLLEAGSPVKYVLVRARGVIVIRSDGSIDLVSARDALKVSDPLTDALLWGDPSRVPSRFRLVQEIKVPGGAYQYARIWKIEGEAVATEPN